jgi:oligo-1,6-glucosidase
MMHFWLEKGVNGFRMDVISLISKDQNFPNFPENRFGDLSYYANGPRVHEFLQEMNHEVLSKYDCMTVGEAFGVAAEQANDYVGKERNELNMIYHFDHAVPRDEICFVEPKPEFKLSELKAIFSKWDKSIANNGWNTVYFGNHDNARMLSRFGDTGIYHQASAKMLATVLLTLRGTPYLYQGDEIGMYNCTFEDISEFNDVQVLNAYKTLVESGDYSPKQFLEASNKIARDHARTPMQWNAESNAGFSDAEKTWLKTNDNYLSINALSQSLDGNSVLNFYKKLIQIRKQTPALIYGDYHDLRPRCNQIWLYLRTFEEKSYLIMNNFTNKKQSFEVKQKFIQKELILANVPIENDESNQRFILKPYESRVYRVFFLPQR